MIFYIATDSEGDTHWVGTQADARAINRQFEQVDVPTSKTELLEFLNCQQKRIDDLARGLSEVGNTSIEIVARGVESTSEELPHISDTEPEPVAALEPEPVDDIMSYGPVRLAPIAEQVVERIGELGEAAFEALDGHMNSTGVGGSFSKGVHILSVLCTSEHQLTRLLFRARGKL